MRFSLFSFVLSVVCLLLYASQARADSWKVTHRDPNGKKSSWVVTQSSCCDAMKTATKTAECKDGKCVPALPATSSSVSVTSSVGGAAPVTVQASACDSGQCSTRSRRRGR